MNKEQMKDEIILAVKNAIADNADIDVDTDTVTTDCNGVDHIAEQVVKELYNAFKPIDKEPIGALGESGRTGKEEQIKEMADIIKASYKEWLDVTGVIPEGTTYYAECLGGSEDCAELLYNAGYRKTFTSDLASDTQKAYKDGYLKGFEDGEEELKNEIYALKVQIGCLEEHCTALEEDNINDEMNLDSLSKELEIISSELSRYTENAKTMCEETKKQAVKEFAEKL